MRFTTVLSAALFLAVPSLTAPVAKPTANDDSIILAPRQTTDDGTTVTTDYGNGDVPSTGGGTGEASSDCVLDGQIVECGDTGFMHADSGAHYIDSKHGKQ